MNRNEVFLLLQGWWYSLPRQQDIQPKFTHMNTKTLLQSAALTGTLAVVFFELAKVNTDLPLMGLVVGYVASVAILAFAAFDGAKRAS